MPVEVILSKLNAELRQKRIGDHRKFKFLMMHLNDRQETINFFIDVLNYKKYQANKVAYNVNYAKNRYLKQLNKPGEIN